MHETIRINRILVDRLFGYFDYELPDPRDGKSDVSSFFTLYGDNGSGKTTILNLIYALLVTKPVAGAKNYIAKTPFFEIKIEFSDRTVLSARKHKEDLVGPYSITIERPNRDKYTYQVKTEGDGSVRQNVSDFMATVAKLGLEIHYLPDDRRASSPFVSQTTSLTVDASGRIIQQQRNSEQSHRLDLHPALDSILQWAQHRAIQGSTRGDENATSIYQRVVAQLARAAVGSGADMPSINQLTQQLIHVSRETDQFAKFGLLTAVPAEEFLKHVNTTNTNSQALIATVLKPYIEGMDARFKALQPLRQEIERFVDAVNLLLNPKKIALSVKEGIKIFDRKNSELSPNVLSSGEKQLLLIFCNAVLVSQSSSLFLIDEPELSLNVKWQQQLLGSLKVLSQGGNVQFILATHSLEILAGHSESTVHLLDKKDAKKT